MRLVLLTRFCTLAVWLLAIATLTLLDTVLCLEPTFDVPIVNVTVVRGQIALLPCSIDFLGKYKVAWLDEGSIPLTYDDRRIVDDTRFSIIRPLVREWNLQVRDVKWEDQGQYRCTVNTQPVKSKVVMLHVKVPAEIISDSTSDDVTVQEGDTVVLTCNVTGIPLPQITWYRRPSPSLRPGHHYDRSRMIGGSGEKIVIRNVTRYSDDIYECVASNGVPPPAVRQIRVTVEFPPEIQLPNRRIGQSRGRETILECIITAFPQAVNYWQKDGRRLTGSNKYRIEAYDEGGHRLTLSMRVQVKDDDDFGDYVCVASNSLGRVEKTTTLYEHRLDTNERQAASVWPVGTSPKRKGPQSRRYNGQNDTHVMATVNGYKRAEKITYLSNEDKLPNDGSSTHETLTRWLTIIFLLTRSVDL